MDHLTHVHTSSTLHTTKQVIHREFSITFDPNDLQRLSSIFLCVYCRALEQAASILKETKNVTEAVSLVERAV